MKWHEKYGGVGRKSMNIIISHILDHSNIPFTVGPLLGDLIDGRGK